MRESPEDNQQERKPCPFCGEMILQIAVKCRYCGEFLDPSQRPEAPSPPPARMTVSDGVRVGVGMFIKLPLILTAIAAGLFILFLLFGWLTRSEDVATKLERESGLCFSSAPTGFERAMEEEACKQRVKARRQMKGPQSGKKP